MAQEERDVFVAQFSETLRVMCKQNFGTRLEFSCAATNQTLVLEYIQQPEIHIINLEHDSSNDSFCTSMSVARTILTNLQLINPDIVMKTLHDTTFFNLPIISQQDIRPIMEAQPKAEMDMRVAFSEAIVAAVSHLYHAFAIVTQPSGFDVTISWSAQTHLQKLAADLHGPGVNL